MTGVSDAAEFGGPRERIADPLEGDPRGGDPGVDAPLVHVTFLACGDEERAALLLTMWIDGDAEGGGMGGEDALFIRRDAATSAEKTLSALRIVGGRGMGWRGMGWRGVGWRGVDASHLESSQLNVLE